MRAFLFISIVLWSYLFSNASVVENPRFDRSDVPSFRISKVEVTKDTTFVHCIYYAESNSWANISKNTFLRDTKTGKKYPIYKCYGIPFSPQQRTFIYDEVCEATFYFPAIKKSKRIDFIEKENEKAFNVYGIDLENSYEKEYRESELKRFSNMASFYDSVGDTVKAIQYKEKEKEASEFLYGIKSEESLLSLLGLSFIYANYGFYEEAIKYMEIYLALQVEVWGKSNRIYATQLSSLARFYAQAKKIEVSIAKYKESIALFDSLGIIDNEYALALRNLSDDYYYIKKFAEAFFFQGKAIQARRAIKDSELYIDELSYTLLRPHGGKSDIKKRIDIIKNELNNLPEFIDNKSLNIAELYKQIALFYSFIEKNEDAISYCNNTLDLLKTNGKSKSIEYAELLALKCKFQQRGKLKDEAISSGTAAKQLYDSLNIRSLKYAELLGDLAWAYGLDLNYEKSIQLQTIAAGIYENAKDWISLAGVYNSISDYYQSAEDLNSAERSIKKAIEILNENDNVEQFLKEEVRRTKNQNINNPFTLESITSIVNSNKSMYYQTLARIYQKRGDYVNAINSQLESGVIEKNFRGDEGYAMSLATLSQYYLGNKQYKEAILCAEKSIQLLPNDSHINIAICKNQLAIACFQAGDTINAIRYAEESFSESQATNDFETIYGTQSTSVYFYWKNNEIEKAEKCLSEELDYLKNFISNELPGMTTEQKQRLWDKYEHNFLLYRNIIEKSNRSDILISKLYDYVLFSKSLLLDADIQKDANRMKITWKDIQQQMSGEDIAIEFISTIEENGTYNTYHALVLDKNNPSPRMITLYGETELEEIKKTTTRNISDIVGELIWKPILAQYGNARNIYFSPYGIMHMIPIEYYNVDSITSMHEYYNMYRLSSTKELVSKYNYKNVNSAVLYGGLDYNELKEVATETDNKQTSGVWRSIADRGGFDPLFNTLVETKEIKDLLEGKDISTTLYTGDKGTEESFRNLSSQNHNIIHLATHGMYIRQDNVLEKKAENNFNFLESLVNDKDPVKEDAILTHSFLVMSGGNKLVTRNLVTGSINDGILTSKEISQLDLRGLDLVVLSACETALGDINSGGIYGLQRGFKKAGANTILMSLNKVDDEATKLLMVEFYKNLMSGKTKHQSLKNAQKYLRSFENGKYDDPKYWASFIMLDGLN